MPLILGTNSIKDTGYDVANSLRFNQPDNPYLTRTISSAGSTTTISISFWFKRAKLTDDLHLFSSNSFDEIKITGSDTLRIESYTGGYNYRKITNRVFRDPSAWYHMLVVFDTSNSTADDRIRLYINGVRETSFSTSQNPSQNYAISYFGTAHPFIIATDARTLTGASNLDGYLSEVVGLDGSALDPTSFGEFDEDSAIWKPIKVSGLTFGTNGFYLNFENSSELGTDVSGNSNTLSESGFTAVEQSIDTCTNNFTTLNRLYLSASSLNFTQGNLTNNGNSSNAWRSIYSTIGLTSGKWYFEFRVNKIKSGDLGNMIVGIVSDDQVVHTADNGKFFGTSRGYGYHGKDGKKLNNDTVTDNGGSYGDSFTTVGDIIGCAIDLDNHKIYWRKNGTYQNSGNPESGATGTGSAFDLASGFTYLVAIATYYDDERYSFNFGSPPYSESGGNSDGNTYGNFAGSVPSGYFSINTKNLAEYG